jgi:putative transposase
MMYALPETNYLGVKLMFQDEAGFGRINKPKRCWAPRGIRPSVPCLHIREYRYAYGAVAPHDGDSFFAMLPYSDTTCMNIFLEKLSEQYPNDWILLVCDRAPWHTTAKLNIPENIKLFFLPAATPELNPIEQIWKEIRTKGFKNEIFKTLDKVVLRLQETVQTLTHETIKSITFRDYMHLCF